MIPIEQIYGGGFFKRRYKIAWRAPIVCSTIKEIFKPETALDVGCAIGDLVLGFTQSGVRGYGLEGSYEALPYLLCEKERIVFHDLRLPILSLPIEFPTRFDVVTCFEVAEHIDPEYVDIFIWNLQALAGKWIIISAAPPGQGGYHHVNCQVPEYWILRMSKHGFVVRPDARDALKSKWELWKKKDGIRAFYNNLLVFERSKVSNG